MKMASQQQKEDLTSATSTALTAVEDNLDAIIANVLTAQNYGMISKPEKDTFANDVRAVKYTVLSIHARMTAIAIREGTDGAIPASGPGR